MCERGGNGVFCAHPARPEAGKLEARISKSETSSNLKFLKRRKTKTGPSVLNLRILPIGICFGFRASDFEFPPAGQLRLSAGLRPPA